MSNEMTREEMLAAMYNPEDDEPTIEKEKPLVSVIDMGGYNRTKKIRMGAITYTVPSVEYVSYLENKILSLTKTVEDLIIKMRKLEIVSHKTKNVITNQANSIVKMNRDLDNKINRRD